MNLLKENLDQDEFIKLINESDEYGYSLIHYFTEVDYFECIKVLISFGADVNIKS